MKIKKQSARKLTDFVTARTTAGCIHLFVGGDQTEAGHYIPASEIFLSMDAVEELLSFIDEVVSDED